MKLKLTIIREILRRSEDSIIFALLERSRWKRNHEIYQASPSIFMDILVKTEIAHAQVGRYLCPEEHPFTSTLPEPDEQHQSQSYSLSDFVDGGSFIYQSQPKHSGVLLREYTSTNHL